MPRKATKTRSTSSPQLKRTAQGKNAGPHITSESIASDVAAFRKQGGHIEVLGITPLRVNVTAARSRGNTRRAATPVTAKPAAAKG
ncbi:hypothetical protein [Stenotrophomonas sp. YIM B06876]|uniref:hypothetical protein n=1 Tax=Stenotrophomonas sp. YIM B06876 TaxID=3060211 RepID=UPI002738A38C|nr:hypothetical protein [Stenotrophomonas sp. YIM B06876]